MRKRELLFAGTLVLLLILSGPRAATLAWNPGERDPSSDLPPPADVRGGGSTGPARDQGSPLQVVWQIETVDAAGDIGRHTSLALEADGTPHISYYDATMGALKHAYYVGTGGNCGATHPGTWQCDTVDSDGDTGLYTSLALQADGTPHISYYDASDGDLWYAHRVGTGGNCGAGAWQCDPIDPPGNVGLYTSLALDSDGHPHISYYDADAQDLKGAFYDGISWTIQRIDGETAVEGEYTSIALKSAAGAAISYFEGGIADNLRYAYQVQPGLGNCGLIEDWQCDTVDSSGLVGQYTSLALDSTDNPRISYHGQNALKYAYYDGNWNVWVITGSGFGAGYTSLALANSDQPHIAYHSVNNSALWYAYYVGTGGNCGITVPNSWQCDPVDTGPDTGEYPALALDGGDQPHISYYNAANTALMYAAGTLCVPVAQVDIAGPHSLLVGETGVYTASYVPPTATPPVTVSWDNGTTGLTTTYSFPLPGTYTVTVTATNPCGQDSSFITVTVCQPVTEVSIDGPVQLKTNEVGVYTATYTPTTATPPVATTWSNGTTGLTTTYSFSLPGTHTVSVTATNPCGEAGAELAVEVCQPLTRVQIAGDGYLDVGITGTYTATYLPLAPTPPVTITWDNGTTGITATYSYTTPGIYTIIVTASNPCSVVSATYPVAVGTCQGLTSVEVAGPGDVAAGETAIFTATQRPLTATLPVTVTWDNGTVGITATYSFTLPGTYTHTVTATNRCSQVGGLFVVNVCDGVNNVQLAWSPLTPTVGQEVVFTGTATGSLPITYTWDLGGAVKGGAVVTHTYTAPGAYTVTLSASNRCSSEAAGRLITVQPRPITRIYLPLVIRNWNPCYLERSGSFYEAEPNNRFVESNGWLCSGVYYYGTPGDPENPPENNDYYHFYAKAGPLSAELCNYDRDAPGQLILYNEAQGFLTYTWSADEDGCWRIVDYPLTETGTYYLRLYTAQVYTQVYQLRATFVDP